MKPGRTALAPITAVLGTVAMLLTLTVGTASAAIVVSRVHGMTTAAAGDGPVYAAHIEVLSGWYPAVCHA